MRIFNPQTFRMYSCLHECENSNEVEVFFLPPMWTRCQPDSCAALSRGNSELQIPICVPGFAILIPTLNKHILSGFDCANRWRQMILGSENIDLFCPSFKGCQFLYHDTLFTCVTQSPVSYSIRFTRFFHQIYIMACVKFLGDSQKKNGLSCAVMFGSRRKKFDDCVGKPGLCGEPLRQPG